MNALRSSLLALTGTIGLLAAPAIAHADGRAWAAIEKRLPNDVYVVGGANLAVLRKSTLFKSLPALVSEDHDAKEVVTMVKKHCKLDVFGAIDDAVVAVADAPGGDEQGVVVIALKGVDHASFDACLSKAAKAKEKLTITSAQQGDITEYTASGEPDKLYIAWLAKDVMAIGVEASDKAVLAKFIGGKGVSAGLAATIGKTNTAGAVWFAMAKDTPLGGMTLKTAFGAITYVSKKFLIEGHIGMASASDATMFATGAKQELTGMIANVPKAMQTILKGINISSIGPEAVVSASIADQKATDLMKMFDKIF